MNMGRNQQGKKALLWIFAERGGGVQTQIQSFKGTFGRTFFKLELGYFFLSGGEPNPNLVRNFFQLKFGQFLRKGGRGADPSPNFLRNFCLLEMRLQKKFLKHVRRYKGGLRFLVQQKSKVELLFFLGSSLSVSINYKCVCGTDPVRVGLKKHYYSHFWIFFSSVLPSPPYPSLIHVANYIT